MTDIKRFRGDTYNIKAYVKKADGVTPQPITGWTFKFTCSDHENPIAGYTPKYQIDGTITDGDNGELEFEFTSTEADFVGTYYWDVQVTDGGGKKATLDKGRLVYEQDITK